LAGNIKSNPKDIWHEGVDYVQLAQRSPVAGCSEYSNEPLGSEKAGNFLTGRLTVTFSRRTLLHGVSDLDVLTKMVTAHAYAVEM
jgi:hypothetical protein